MALKPFKSEKIYYSIREVAGMFDVNESLLRYWEREFDVISPKKTAGGTRQYKKEDIENIRLVYYLVKQRGMTLAGAKQKLKENRDTVAKTTEVVSLLEDIKAELTLLRKEFEALDSAEG